MNINPQCIRKKVDNELINQAQDLIKEQKNLLKKKSEIFSLLGNESRLSIVYLLINYEKLCVCDISDILNISQSATSQHLRKLKDGYVFCRLGEEIEDIDFRKRSKLPELMTEFDFIRKLSRKLNKELKK